MRLAAALGSRWSRALPRERIVAILAGALVVFGGGYFLVFSPLERSLAAAESELARERALLERAKRQADESAGLARAPAAAATDVRTAVERIVAQRGLRNATISFDAREGRVRVVLADARVDALAGALESLAREANLRAVEASLVARVEPGTVRADLTLAR